jgi:hypothetical protein
VRERATVGFSADEIDAMRAMRRRIRANLEPGKAVAGSKEAVNLRRVQWA